METAARLPFKERHNNVRTTDDGARGGGGGGDGGDLGSDDEKNENHLQLEEGKTGSEMTSPVTVLF